MSDLEVARAAGFTGEKDAERAFREAGVNRVVDGLRAENTRLRQRLRAAEHAAQAGEDRADGEKRGEERRGEEPVDVVVTTL